LENWKAPVLLARAVAAARQRQGIAGFGPPYEADLRALRVYANRRTDRSLRAKAWCNRRRAIEREGEIDAGGITRRVGSGLSAGHDRHRQVAAASVLRG